MIFFLAAVSFSALTLFVWQREGHLSHKNLRGCFRGQRLMRPRPDMFEAKATGICPQDVLVQASI